MKEAIRETILTLGADVCGFAAIDRFHSAPEGFRPTDVFHACRAVVAFGVALPRGLYQVSPRLIYKHYNDGSCDYVDEIAFRAARQIERITGLAAVPMPSDGPYEAWDAEAREGRGLISMKHAAVQAGLGTMGKSTLLVNARYGNRLTLGAVLTQCALESDPYAQSVCVEGCRRCLDNCPVHAIADGHVTQKLCRAHAYGQNARGFETVNCNACRAACPVRDGT